MINFWVKGGIKWSKLIGDDLEFIEILKIEKLFVLFVEIISCFEEMDGEEVLMVIVFRVFKYRLLLGFYMRKKIMKIVFEWFI